MKSQNKDISTQSKNEVKEILDEYVVSPLSKDILRIKSQMEESVIKVDENMDSIKRQLNQISDNLRWLKKKLDISFHFDDEEDAFEKLLDELDFDRKLENTTEPIANEIKNTEKLLEKLEQEVSDSSNSIKVEVANTKTNISEKIAELQGKQELCSDDIKKDIAQIFEKIQHLERVLEDNERLHQKELSKVVGKTDKISGLQSENYKEIVNLLQEMKSSIVAEADRKHRALMFSLISVNVVELIGIAALILHVF